MALPIIKLGLAAAAGYYFYNRFRKSRASGSTTNASDAVDDVKLGPKSEGIERRHDFAREELHVPAREVGGKRAKLAQDEQVANAHFLPVIPERA